MRTPSGIGTAKLVSRHITLFGSRGKKKRGNYAEYSTSVPPCWIWISEGRRSMRIYSVFENEQWNGDMTADDISQMLKGLVRA